MEFRVRLQVNAEVVTEALPQLSDAGEIGVSAAEYFHYRSADRGFELNGVFATAFAAQRLGAYLLTVS